jgi:hypothetical protein
MYSTRRLQRPEARLARDRRHPIGQAHASSCPRADNRSIFRFAAGIRGAVTFGKPWRSCVTVGGEYLGSVGPTGWVRLQWDTAPPLLMGASIVRTDLPGVVIDAGGLYLAYDVMYRMAERFAVRAQLSYGARDGAASIGGDLGTAVDF